MGYQRDYDKTLRVGIIGAGSHCYRNILPTMNYLPVAVTAICDINAAAAQKTARQYANCSWYTSADTMYRQEDLDAVFISTGPQWHPGLSIEALQAGVHVWVEKPVAMRCTEVEEMIKHRGDKVVVVGMKKAFMPVTEKAIEIVQSMKYGNLKTILAVYRMSIPANGREVLEQRQFTDWLANAVHPLAFMMAVGGSVKSVTTHCQADGHGICILEFRNGVIGNFHLASGAYPMETYSLFGDTWHLDIHNNNRIELQRGIPFQYGKTTSFIAEGDESGAVVWEAQNCLATLENKALFTQGFYAEMKYFCDCILEQKQPVKGSLEFALELMKVYEAGLLSQGRTILIDDV